jgi:glycosyltransferase involved in cell wall biosynthesis
MAKIKFSVITTVKDEAASIEKLLDSIDDQTEKPEEVVIVDAGSTDKTTELITNWNNSHKLTTKLIIEPGVNRSTGRNIAINQADNDHIAVIDGGCIAKNDWLENLGHDFLIDPKIEVVAGFYQTKPNSKWQESITPFLAVMPDQLDSQNYLPSSRSVAFTKNAWQKVGGYPIDLTTCEDLVFAKKLQQQCKMVVEPKAIVRWELPNNWKQYYRQISGYATGDMQAKYWPHVSHNLIVFGRYLLLGFFPWLIILYLIYPLIKHFRYMKSFSSLLWLPLVQIITDIAIMCGSIKGVGMKLNQTKARNT